MHVLERNKQDLYYSNVAGKNYVVDENGFMTGEVTLAYTQPVKVKMSMAISSGANNLGSQGMAELEQYGITTGYTHRAVTDDLTCDMNEDSLVWYKITPENGTHANFRVVRKAQSLNHLIFYLKEVDVS